MNRILPAIAVAGLTAFLAAPAVAQFDVSYFEGSRGDVRGWCAIEDGVLSDREDYTMCIVNDFGVATITCDDARSCTRTGFDVIETGAIGRNPGQTVTLATE